jgi:hypothetical protein
MFETKNKGALAKLKEIVKGALGKLPDNIKQNIRTNDDYFELLKKEDNIEKKRGGTNIIMKTSAGISINVFIIHSQMKVCRGYIKE